MKVSSSTFMLSPVAFPPPSSSVEVAVVEKGQNRQRPCGAAIHAVGAIPLDDRDVSSRLKGVVAGEVRSRDEHRATPKSRSSSGSAWKSQTNRSSAARASRNRHARGTPHPCREEAWDNAAYHCANLDLRLPTLSEALALAQTHDIPNVDQEEFFWTQDRYVTSNGVFTTFIVDDKAGFSTTSPPASLETVCVTTPTN